MKIKTNKINSFLMASLVSVFIVGCSNTSDITLTPDNTIKTFTSDGNPVDTTETLSRINKAIDAVIPERNTENNNYLKLYVDGVEAYPELENMLLSAKKSIYFEVFQYANDASGKKIADILVKKAKEGINVHFLYDFIGNINISLYNYMAKNGVHVETYGKNQLNNKSRITHRKVYIIDGTRAMTGGMNIGDMFAGTIPDYCHDMMISYEGQAVKETLKEFLYDWKISGGKVTDEMTTYLNSPSIYSDTEKKYSLRVAVTSPVENKTDIKNMMFAAIDNARDTVKIAMPYFTEDNIINHLIAAQQRGVKVTALIPTKASFIGAVNIVNDMTANQLTEAGVEVFRGGADGTRNHTKVITIDNSWTTIGSCNADYRALNANQELNVAISEPEFTQQINSRFFDKFVGQASKWEYKKIAWYKKPLYDILEGIDDLF